MFDLNLIHAQAQAALIALHAITREDFYPAKLVVVGCSSSEITGGHIGKASSPEVGEAVAEAMLAVAKERGFDLAFQCCEHLNRALVVERDRAAQLGLDLAWVVPQPKAGGSCAAAAYRLMRDPVVVESIRADAGLDIGGTLIGMHLRPVAVPVRLPIAAIGEAPILAARSRPRLIGGPRASYAIDQV